MSTFTLIVAATTSNGIGVLHGACASLPWRLPREMAYFARITSNAPEGMRNAVIMGRRTWDSIPVKFRPLRNRLNVVLSRDRSLDIGGKENAILRGNLRDALQATAVDDPGAVPIHRRFIIGGASIYNDSMQSYDEHSRPLVDRILLTRVFSPAFDECNVFFPSLNSQETGTAWMQAPHDALREWAGFEVPDGVQEENGVKYEYQLWVRTPN